jgi:hypothetical protein
MHPTPKPLENRGEAYLTILVNFRRFGKVHSRESVSLVGAWVCGMGATGSGGREATPFPPRRKCIHQSIPLLTFFTPIAPI